jgi:hypothetical protein
MRVFQAVSMSAVLLLVSGCGDISAVQSGQLDISPAELLFPAPDPGSQSRRLAVELTNIGKGPVIIANVGLSESDETKELALVDSDDWQQARTIQPEQTERIFVEWVATDAQADQGYVN